jgi:hypothetical protein
MDEVDPFLVDAGGLDEIQLREFPARGGPQLLGFAGDKFSPNDWDEDYKCVVRAPRGFGKSHLLLWRSLNHRNSDVAKRTVFYPNSRFVKGGKTLRELAESLTSVSGNVPHWLKGKTRAYEWSKLWQIAIIGLLVWRTEANRDELSGYNSTFGTLIEFTAPPEIDDEGAEEVEVQHPGASARWFVARLLERLPADDSEGADQIERWMFQAEKWAQAIQARLANLKMQRIAVYLDNPDEMVRMSSDLNVWCNIQQGLLIAISKLRKGGQLKHVLRIFCSVRSEAFDNGNDDAALQQAYDHVVRISYTKDQLCEILQDRMAKLLFGKDAKLERTSADPLVSFCGFSTIVHNNRIDSKGEPYSETLFESIVRHTRWVPRELIEIGKAILSDHRVSGAPPTVDSARQSVNAAASKNVKWAIQNSILGWNAAVESFAARLPGELIAGEEIRQLAERHAQDGVNPVKLLIRHGLLGVSEKPVNGPHKHFYYQRFSYDQSHGALDAATTQKAFYFVHPALKEWIRTRDDLRTGIPEFVPMKVGAVGDWLPYEAEQPTYRLARHQDVAVLIVGGSNIAKKLGVHLSDPLRFLFAALFSAREKKSTVLAVSEIVDQIKKLTDEKNQTRVHLVSVPRTRKDPRSTLSDWQKKINTEAVRLKLVPHVRGRKGPKSEANSTESFLSFSAVKSGAMTFTFNHLDIETIVIDETLRAS